jgi:hypothetical protein
MEQAEQQQASQQHDSQTQQQQQQQTSMQTQSQQQDLEEDGGDSDARLVSEQQQQQALAPEQRARPAMPLQHSLPTLLGQNPSQVQAARSGLFSERWQQQELPGGLAGPSGRPAADNWRAAPKSAAAGEDPCCLEPVRVAC